jgi:hypothetical protein
VAKIRCASSPAFEIGVKGEAVETLVACRGELDWLSKVFGGEKVLETDKDGGSIPDMNGIDSVDCRLVLLVGLAIP